MIETKHDLERQYTRALQRHLACGDEATLHSAYELGRRGLGDRLGVLDVAGLLHQALVQACLLAPTQEESARMMRAAEEFVLECFSPFEMAYRGIHDANTALRRLNEVLEENIKSIAHELHDEAGQLLASVYLVLDGVVRDLEPPARERLQAVRLLLHRVEEEIRRISHELRPTILDDLGLLPALEFLGKGVAARTGLSITVEGSTQGRLPPAAETALYRIVQEALTNATKHAQASRVEIRLHRAETQIRCSIRDDGIGFDAAAVLTNGKTHGFGLIGIRERLAALGGTLRVVSTRDGGTELVAAIPLEH